MKCKFCGAEIKTGSRVCEYCGSEAEQTIFSSQSTTKSPQTSKSITRIIGRILIFLACIWAAVAIISTIIVLNSDVIKNAQEYSPDTKAAHEMPRDKAELSGQIVDCDENGTASIEYNNYTYTKVQILDTELINWLNETNRSIDTVGIRFATDKNGDIRELGLLTADFFIMAKEDTRYIAIRDGQVVSFTSDIPLETNHYYGGYFCYPNIRLYWGEEKSPFTMTYMDPKCEDKESTTEQDNYTKEDITVYKILVGGTWYYCSKETYDTVQTGSLLNGYEIYSDENTSFIWKK